MNRLFKLFLVGVACAVFSVRFDADAATYHFDLPSKTLEGGTMALGENAELVLRNIGGADPAALRTLLCDKEGNYLAASTNGFRAAGTAAVGDMSLATAALAARFEGMSAIKEIPLVFAVWDTANGTLLGSSLVQVKNNPLADADGTVPMDWGGVDYGDVAIAQQAYGMATNAWQLSVATSNRMDALHGDYTAATNDLWEALNSATGGLSGDISALSATNANAISNLAAAVGADMEALSDEIGALREEKDAVAASLEPAFTNGTAKGLAVAMPEDWAEADADDGLEASPFAGALRVAESQSRALPRQLWLESTLNLLGLSLVADGDEVAGISLRREAGIGQGYISLYAPGGVRTEAPIRSGGLTLGERTVTSWSELDQSAAVTTIQRYEQQNKQSIDTINGILTGQNGVTSRLDKAIADIDGLDGRLGDLEDETFDWRTEEVGRLEQLEAGSESMDGRVTAAETAIAGLSTTNSQHETALAGLRADVDALSGQSAATFTNGTARGLAITPIDHRAVYEAGFSSTPGVWATTEYDYLGEPYGHHLLLHGEGTAALDLSSTGIVANADVAAEGFTLGTNTVTDWEVFATAESVTLARQDIERLQEAIANGGGSGTATGDIVANSIQMGSRTIYAWTDLTDPLWSGIRNASNALRTAVSGAASQAWVSGQMGELRTDVDDFYDTFAERIDSLQETIDALDDITDGQTSVDLSSITADIASLKSATNYLRETMFPINGGTLHGSLSVTGSKFEVGSDVHATGLHSIAMGWRANASNAHSFVWGGSGGVYGSHGPGTFNINPVDGLDGFWIGQRTLSDLIAEQTAWQMGEDGLSVPSLQVGRDLATGNNWAGSADAALAQGVRSVAAGRGAVAAGRQADATNDWAFTWSGAEPEVDWEVFPTRVFEAEEGVPFVLSTNLPYTPTLGGFLGTGDYNEDSPRGWNNGDTVTFVGWKAASGQPETFRYEDGHWYDTDEDGDWTDGNYFTGEEEMAPLFFQCPMVFHGDADHDRANDRFSWVATVQNFKRYGDHGAGTFNVNPVGGLDGFYVGDATLADAIAAHGVASLNDADGDVTLQAASPLSISPDPQDGSILKLSFADTYVRTLNGQSGDVTLTSSGGGISFNGATVENAGVTQITYVSPTAGLGGTYPAYSWSGDVQIGVRDGYFSIKRAEEGNDAWHKLFEIGGGGGGAQALPVFSLGSTSPRLTVTPGGTYSYTLSLAPAVDSLNGATGALRLLSPSGAQLGVTDGAIRLPEPPNALTAMGEDVLAPVLVVEENSPRITGFEVDEFGDAVITFWGSATTNRLEWLSAEAESEWAPWDMCSWSYSGTTGTVTVVGAEQGAFYRIVVPEGYGTPDRTNVFLVASVPVYLDDPSVPGNRLATLADVQEAVERGGGAAKTPVVTRRAYKDNMSGVPTNGVAWNFDNDGVYIADLSVGGWTEETATVTTNEGTVATNTTTVTHPGTMTLNGETIRSWAELATYADGVEFTVETGVESLNGAEGPVRIVAGDNVSIETDTATGTITISATGGGGGGGGGGSADTNAIVAAAVAAVEAHDFQTLTLGGVERNAWPTGGSSGGVASVNGAAGEVTIASGGGITINQSGSAITLSATGGGVGTWSMNSRLLTGASNEVAYSDYLIWMDSEAAGTNQVLTLPNMTNDAQTIVVRHLGNDYPTIIRHGESEWLLQGDGAAVAFDWLLQKGKWFYRQAY